MILNNRKSSDLFIYSIPIILAVTLWFPKLSFGIYYGLLAFVLLSFILSDYTGFMKFNKVSLYFSITFIGLSFVSSFSVWKPGYDFKDIIGVLSFFVVYPGVIANLLRFNSRYHLKLRSSLNFSFYLMTGLMVLFTAMRGIDFSENSILGIQKNGVALVYEPLLVYFIFSRSSNQTKYWLWLIYFFALIALLGIGSKTTILLVSLFAVAKYNVKLFRLLLFCGVAISVIVSLYFASNTVLLTTLVFRFSLWARALVDIFASWQFFLFGNGPNTFIMDWNIPGVYMKDAIHNYYLQFLHNFGFISFSIFTFMFFKVFIRFKNFFQYPAQVSLLVFALHSIFDVGWVKGQGFLISIFMGIALYRKWYE